VNRVAAIVGVVVLAGIGGLVAADLGPWGGQSLTVHPAAAAALLTPLTLLLAHRVVDGDPRLFRLLALAWGVKLVGVILRYHVIKSSYGHLADAAYYHQSATTIAGWLEEGWFGPYDPRVVFRGPGTSHLAYAIGLVYRVTGARMLTGYVVLAWWAFVGVLCFYRAAITAVPQLDRRLLALLLFFLPTMVFWPSSLGKDAWTVGALGLVALGVARFARGHLDVGTLALLAVGLFLVAFVRPHIAALAAGSFALAALWPGRVPGERGGRRWVSMAVGLVLLLLAGSLLNGFMDRLGFAEDQRDLSQLLTKTTEQTSTGESEFAPTALASPRVIVPAIVTTYLRPFPFEARSPVQLITALEGVALVAVVWRWRHRLRSLPTALNRSLYLRFCLVYSIGFALAFSQVGNFGILARQRSQLWPLFLVLLAMPAVNRRPLPQAPQLADGGRRS
jgi:hypothetical protein